jgi:hypothetical protein
LEAVFPVLGPRSCEPLQALEPRHHGALGISRTGTPALPLC